ncbi:MAG: OmpH family outer membrane protein [Rhodospirillales bacterium]|jgi:outer membrane protein|nr:OmpH family outer membrane protein [Rhodospirillales bacterium]MBT4005990.1 OmpH family outer membrane protein [Rhodospirillales bacterium]MBT5075717.1 OmpH family outer membrane protein [Rhodospirillales bacterium]MBT5112733.1 OmpH family outer membrane protein [Rhodospirillales bacterium]MBT5673503.1 OmpH family outer membrane protein [Rhodospirillales bacterium]
MMMIRNSWPVLLCLLILMGTSTLTSAQEKKGGTEAGASGMAFLDIVKVRLRSKAGKSISKQFNARRKKLLKLASKEEKELFAAREALKRQLSLLSPDAIRQREVAFKKKFTIAQRKFQNRKRALKKAVADAWKIFERELQKVLKVIVKKGKIAVIFDTRQTFFTAAQYEITDDAIKRLNVRLPKVVIGKTGK